MFPSKKQMKKTYLELAKVGFYFALTIACAICAEVILFTQYDENGVIAMSEFALAFGILAILKLKEVPAIYMAEHPDEADD